MVLLMMEILHDCIYQNLWKKGSIVYMGLCRTYIMNSMDKRMTPAPASFLLSHREDGARPGELHHGDPSHREVPKAAAFCSVLRSFSLHREKLTWNLKRVL